MAIDTVHEVEARLAALEKRYGIRILYAVEAPLSRTHAPGRRD